MVCRMSCEEPTKANNEKRNLLGRHNLAGQKTMKSTTFVFLSYILCAEWFLNADQDRSALHEGLSAAAYLYSKQNFSEALALYDKLSTESRESAPAIRSFVVSGKALCFKALGYQLIHWRPLLEHAVVLDPTSLLAWIQLADVELSEDMLESARTRSTQVLLRLIPWQMPKSRGGTPNRGADGGVDFHFSSQLIRDSIRLAGEWIRSGISHLRASDPTRAGRLCDAGRSLFARAAAAAAIPIDPARLAADTFTALECSAAARFADAALPDAAALYARAARLRPASAVAWLNLANTEANALRYRRADAAYARALAAAAAAADSDESVAAEALCNRIQCRIDSCRWDNDYPAAVAAVRSLTHRQLSRPAGAPPPTLRPLQALYLPLGPELAAAVAAAHAAAAARDAASAAPPGWAPPPPPHAPVWWAAAAAGSGGSGGRRRLRVGWMSSHVREHNTGLQLVGVLTWQAPRDLAAYTVRPSQHRVTWRRVTFAPRDVAPRDLAPRYLAPCDLAPRDLVPRDICSASRVLHHLKGSCHVTLRRTRPGPGPGDQEGIRRRRNEGCGHCPIKREGGREGGRGLGGWERARKRGARNAER
jgi:tetratricopeptide (TPR) repeat protein